MGLLGVHCSITGGIFKAIEAGNSLGCEAIQIFNKNQRQWQTKPLAEENVEHFHAVWQLSNIRKVIVHDSYLINLANPDKDKREKSITAFEDEIRRAMLLETEGLVFHPGAYLSSSLKSGISRIAEAINQILSETGLTISLCIENTCGAGTQIGASLDELAMIIEQVKYPETMGICLDTAHLFQSGVTIHSEESCLRFWNRFKELFGMEKLKVFHLNDSKSGAGSHIDRHACIGKGEIGLQTFRLLVNDQRFEQIPMILEIPGDKKVYRENLHCLKQLRQESGRTEWL